jgi:porin
MRQENDKTCGETGRRPRLRAVLAAAVLALPSTGHAFSVSEKLDVTMALRGLLQHGNYSNALDADGRELDTRTKGAGVFDLMVDYRPTGAGTFYGWARFAAGNALNDVGGVDLEPYGEPLEDELRDINGSGRNYLLEAWYQHRFAPTDGTSLSVTAGIVDAGEYLGENEFADEADTQFMNEALETSSIDMLSYSPGGILEVETGDWSFNVVYTRSKNEEGSRFNWYSALVAYEAETALGEGNYRFFAFTSDGAFDNAGGTRDDERFRGGGLSFDQELGDIFGGFVRVIRADDDAVVDFHRLYSGGVNINGRLWGRTQDNAGIGYGYLEGPPGSELRRAGVAEAYVRFQLTDRLDLSLDLQYQENRLRDEADEEDDGEAEGGLDPSAWVAGIRVNLVF